MTKIPIMFKLMEERNVTAYKLSADTGIPQSTICDWRKGVSFPKISALITIADYFDVSIDYLVGRTKSKK